MGADTSEKGTTNPSYSFHLDPFGLPALSKSNFNGDCVLVGQLLYTEYGINIKYNL
jgi:hypothetical protein